MRIQAIAFDVDGTLYPNNVMYLRSVPFALAHARLLRCYGRVRRNIRTVRPIQNFRLLQAQMLAAEMQISETRAAELVEREIYAKWEQVLKRTPLFGGLVDVLESSRRSGIRLGLLSDFPVERKLAYLGLDGVWDCCISAETTGYLKPNPEPFIALHECLGVPVAETLYVGNSYSYDVVGAKSAGMQAAHLARKPEPDSVADLTFSDYRRLSAWIQARLP